MLEAEDIYFSYKQPVLNGISVAVRKSELLAILGPNGSGKSTLVQILAGLLRPERGTVKLNGRLMAQYRRNELARLIAYVAQDVAVHFPMTVMEFVLQGRFAHVNGFGFEKPSDIAIAEKALQLTDTLQLAARRTSEVSGGERQRVILARALAQEPEILLLDEPTANLDISYQVSALKLIKGLVRTNNLAAVVITHEINLAAEFADRVLLLKNGEAAAYGRPDEILTEKNLSDLFGTKLLVDTNPFSGAPRITFSAK